MSKLFLKYSINFNFAEVRGVHGKAYYRSACICIGKGGGMRNSAGIMSCFWDDEAGQGVALKGKGDWISLG